MTNRDRHRSITCTDMY